LFACQNPKPWTRPCAQGTEYPPPPALKKELIATVREVIGPIATPDVIHWAPGLPKTRSGKIMRRILRKIATKCAPAPRSRGGPPAASSSHCRTSTRAAAARLAGAPGMPTPVPLAC
jgi:hypothetical protein